MYVSNVFSIDQVAFISIVSLVMYVEYSECFNL